LIVAAGGGEVETLTDLRDALDPLAPGDPVTLAILRDGERSEHELVTQPSVDDPARAVIGVIVEQAATIDLPVEISFDAGSIGGPSAGLAFALDIVDELGHDVDQGRVVVVTGELGLDGSVAAVGGVKQKVIGAMESGADVFVVPEANAEEARRWADTGIEILPVETFKEALAGLGATPVPS
jgi:PDZ domain-containing protein